jgi:acetyl-CoA carboxylase carboxyltransferase component
VAHYLAKDDADCLEEIRRLAGYWPEQQRAAAPDLLPEDIYAILPGDHRLPYDMEKVVALIFDREDFIEFQPAFAPEILCANARLAGRPVALIANRRGFLKTETGPRVGGIIYTETARKVSYFVENAERHGLPIVYLQDVSGFMVGPDAERAGIIRAGADMVESMACATVPKIVLTLNHASGAGYYAMAGQGFDPNFTFSWPTARIGVMEGDSAVQALYSAELEKLREKGEPPPRELQGAIDRTRADYERWLDARYAAARGHMDAVIDPRESRAVLAFALDVVSCRPRADHLAIETLA